MKIQDHLSVQPKPLSSAPLAPGEAMPIEKYAIDGNRLTLVVAHDITCRFDSVLLGTETTADVIVVYTPSEVTPSTTSGGTRHPMSCRGNGVLTVHTALDIVLPATRQVSEVRDAGGNGATTLVR